MPISNTEFKRILLGKLANFNLLPEAKAFFQACANQVPERDGELLPEADVGDTPELVAVRALLNIEDVEDVKTRINTLVDVITDEGTINDLSEEADLLRTAAVSFGLNDNATLRKIYAAKQYNYYFSAGGKPQHFEEATMNGIGSNDHAEDHDKLKALRGHLVVRMAAIDTTAEIKTIFEPQLNILCDSAKTKAEIKTAFSAIGVTDDDAATAASGDFFARNQYDKFIDATTGKLRTEGDAIDAIPSLTAEDEHLIKEKRSAIIAKIAAAPDIAGTADVKALLATNLALLHDTNRTRGEMQATFQLLGFPDHADLGSKYFAKNQVDKFIGADGVPAAALSLGDHPLLASHKAYINSKRNLISDKIQTNNALTASEGVGANSVKNFLESNLKVLADSTKGKTEIETALTNLGVVDADLSTKSEAFFAENQFNKYFITTPADAELDATKNAKFIEAVAALDDAKKQAVITKIQNIFATKVPKIDTAAAAKDEIKARLKAIKEANSLAVLEAKMRELGLIDTGPLSGPNKTLRDKIFAENQYHRVVAKLTSEGSNEHLVNLLSAAHAKDRWISGFEEHAESAIKTEEHVDINMTYLTTATTLDSLSKVSSILGLDGISDVNKKKLIAENLFNELRKENSALTSFFNANKASIQATFAAGTGTAPISMNQARNLISDVKKATDEASLTEALTALGIPSLESSAKDVLLQNIQLQNTISDPILVPKGSALHALLNYKGEDADPAKRINIQEKLTDYLEGKPAADVQSFFNSIITATNPTELMKIFSTTMPPIIDLVSETSVVGPAGPYFYEKKVKKLGPVALTWGEGYRSGNKYTDEGKKVATLITKVAEENQKKILQTKELVGKDNLNKDLKYYQGEIDRVGPVRRQEIQKDVAAKQSDLMKYQAFLTKKISEEKNPSRQQILKKQLTDTNQKLNLITARNTGLNAKFNRDKQGEIYAQTGDETFVTMRTLVNQTNYTATPTSDQKYKKVLDGVEAGASNEAIKKKAVEEFQGTPAYNPAVDPAAIFTYTDSNNNEPIGKTFIKEVLEIKTQIGQGPDSIRSLTLAEKHADGSVRAELFFNPQDNELKYQHTRVGVKFIEIPNNLRLKESMLYYTKALEIVQSKSPYIEDPIVTIRNTHMPKDAYMACVLCSTLMGQPVSTTYQPKKEEVIAYARTIINQSGKVDSPFTQQDIAMVKSALTRFLGKDKADSLEPKRGPGVR